MKKQIQNRVWVVSFILVAVMAMLYFQTSAPLSVAYDYQCSLPNCPYGYTLADKYCEGKTCYGICEKPVPAYCGDYGSWMMKESTKNWDGDLHRGTYFNSPALYPQPDKCYIAKAEARFIPSDMGTADSFNLYVTGAGRTGSQCITGLHTTTLGLQEKTYGHTTSSIMTSAKVTDYGYANCGGYTPLWNMKGLITTTIKYREADWIDNEVITDEISCSFECNSDSDCGSTGYVGSSYCSSGNIVQIYESSSCSNYKCSSSSDEQIITFCDYGCEAGQCIQKDLVSFYRLQNNECIPIQIYQEDKTQNDYLTLSECQSHIEEQSILIYRLEDNCNSLYIKISQRTSNDYDTRALCMEQINKQVKYYRLQDNECSTIMLYPNEKSESDYLTLQECNEAKEVEPVDNLLELILGGITLLLLIILLVIWIVRRR